MVPGRHAGILSGIAAGRHGLRPGDRRQASVSRTAVTPVRWWQALDPRIYLISILPGGAVWLLTGASGQPLAAVGLASLAVVLLQHAINVLNDVSDWRLGADAEKHHSWVRFHDQALHIATGHGYASLVLGGALGLAVLVTVDKVWILLIAVPLVLLGWLYNAGPRPLSYTRLGEWVTGVCYAGVFGCLWLLAGDGPAGGAISGSLAFFALSVALLLSHQPPQIETDRLAGKRSFAVRYGTDRAVQGARGLFLLFLLTFGISLWYSNPSVALRFVFVALAVLAALVLVRVQPSPRSVLMAGSSVILGLLPAGWLLA